MGYIIDNVDFHSLEAMKYWSAPASWSDEKRRNEVKNRIFSGDWLGARKMDGAFYQFNKGINGEMELIGRSVGVGGDYLNKIEWLPQCKHFFDAMPNGTSLLGEVVFPNNEGSKNTTTIMGCLKEKAWNRQKTKPIHYYVFDCLAYNGVSYVNTAASDRFNVVRGLSEDFGAEECIDFAVYYEGEALWEQLQDILASGGEGIVITKKSAVYEPGKRPSKTTMKVKKELSETVDCVVIGANAPTKEYTGKELEVWPYWLNTVTNEKLNTNQYKGYVRGDTVIPVTKTWFNNWAGSLKIGLYKDGELVHFGDLSGITDEVKQNWRDYVGKVCEVGGMELFKDTGTNAIRHPKLIAWRNDKLPQDCQWSQVE